MVVMLIIKKMFILMTMVLLTLMLVIMLTVVKNKVDFGEDTAGNREEVNGKSKL